MMTEKVLKISCILCLCVCVCVAFRVHQRHILLGDGGGHCSGAEESQPQSGVR